MTKLLWGIVFCICAVGQMSAAETREKDERAIRQIVESWAIAWQNGDSQLAIEGFSEDADWMNAFGNKTKGRSELKKFLDWAFSLPNAKERKDTETLSSIRFVRPDVAIAYTDFHVEKQRYPTGEEMADRIGHTIRVLVKENSHWQIISMFIMDEKPRAHSSSDKGWPTKNRY